MVLVGAWEFALIYGTIGLIYLILVGEFRSVTKKQKVDIPKSFYEGKMAKYKKELAEVTKQNELLKKENDQKVREIEMSISQSDIEKAKDAIYYSNLKPISSFSRNLENRKRGRTELMFLNRLFKEFGHQIKVDVSPDGINYFPDFTFVCEKTGLHIDIEIDEPYSIMEKEPIHYLQSDDDYRNECFLVQNWCVIRFAEKQIVLQSDQCIQFIRDFVKSIQNKSLSFIHNIEPVERWTYEESLVMAFNNSRDSY